MSYINPFATHADPPGSHQLYTRPEAITRLELSERLSFIGWAPLYVRHHFDGWPWARSIWHESETNCPTWSNGECHCMVEVE